MDYDEDGYADLLVGAPDEDTTAGANAGSETILWGSPSGLTGTASSAMGEPDGAGAAHRFGYSLVSADFDGDGYGDVAVGGADESNGVGGHVRVYKGDADVTLGTTSTISQNSQWRHRDGLGHLRGRNARHQR